MTDDYGYRSFILKALKSTKVEFDEDMIVDLILRFTIVNGMIKAMNDYNPAKGLRSTQVMAKIIFDYLQERKDG